MNSETRMVLEILVVVVIVTIIKPFAKLHGEIDRWRSRLRANREVDDG